MKILAIDTSNQVMSVALIDEHQVIAEYTTNVSKNHSVRLLPAINTIMSESNIQPKELDRIAVAIGPGSFTGVRIGVTTAKTMAWSLNIPVIPVSSLELVAYNGIHFNGLICPFFDARRGQVYTSLYKSNGEKLEQVQEESNVIFADWLKDLDHTEENILFLSNDFDIHKETIETILGNRAVYAPTYLNSPKSSVLGQLGLKKEAVDNIHELVPNYLRLVEAEAKWLEQQRANHDE